MNKTIIHTEPTQYHYDNTKWLYKFMYAFFFGFVQNDDYDYDLKPNKKVNNLPITLYTYDTFRVLNYDYDYFCGNMNKLALQNGCCSVSAASSGVFWKHTATEFETGFDYFGARYYSSDISIWLSVDPMATKYPSMSSYMYCAGNPIMLVDPNGKEFEDPADKARARKSQENARTIISVLNSKIKNLKSKDNLTKAEKQTLSDSEAQVDILNTHIKNIDDMIETKEYKYKYNEHDGTGSMAGIYVDENGVINMEYIEGRADKQAHEEAHGHQFITGELKIENGVENQEYYDLGDEAKAYQVEYSFKNEKKQAFFRSEVGVTSVSDITPESLSKSKVMKKFYPRIVKKYKKSQKRK